MRITVSRLRENIYRLLDEAIDSGKRIEVVRKGTILTIVPPKRVSKLDKLKKRDILTGDPADIIRIDWSREWSAGKAFPQKSTPKCEGLR